MSSIVELTGQPGTGKTTIACGFSELLLQQKVLFVDTDPSQVLSLALTQRLATITLTDVLQSMTDKLIIQESIDWSFNELPVNIQNEQDILVLGTDPLSALPEENQKKLRYGLSRLIRLYDFIIIDGKFPLLGALFPNQPLQSIEIVSPKQLNDWTLPAFYTPLHAQAAILNQFNDAAQKLPIAFNQALLSHQIQLLGKLPYYHSESHLHEHLATDLQQCILRLNMDFKLKHHL